MPQQSRGQFISSSCVDSPTDYICSPCSQYCPAGTYIAKKCDGLGRVDTGCSLCTSSCRAAERGVYEGEYVKNSCTGETSTDVQTCERCRSCPAGTWAEQMCNGRDIRDTTDCRPCITSCSNQTHFYLKGDCVLEKASCALCDPPCDTNTFETVRECANNLNR